MLEIVSLVHAWFEATFIEAKIVVFFTGIFLGRLWDTTSYLVWIALLIESLVVRGLEIVVYMVLGRHN